MKVLKILFLGLAMLLFTTGQAQVSVNVRVGVPPPWGPVGFNSVHYYYLPAVEAYYDVQASMFIYYGGGQWIHRSHLPDQYRNYDLYGGYKVVMSDYHGNTPYTHFKEYKTKYGRGYHGYAQRPIGERPGGGNHPGNNGHPSDHGNNRSNHDNDKGGGHGHDNGNSHGNDKGSPHGNDKGNSHGNDHGHDSGNDKKK